MGQNIFQDSFTTVYLRVPTGNTETDSFLLKLNYFGALLCYCVLVKQKEIKWVKRGILN